MYHADHIGPSDSSTADIENHSKDFALRPERRSIVVSRKKRKLTVLEQVVNIIGVSTSS